MALKQFFDTANFTGKLIFNEPMARHTTLGIGGPAEVMCFPDSIDELARLLGLATREGISVFILGNGSNILVRDGGIPGIVINMSGLNWLEIERGEHGAVQVHAGAGAKLSKLIQYCAESGLAGMEFAAGIPGTVGGAVVMNAGAGGTEMKEVLTKITLVGMDGTVSKVQAKSLDMRYRNGGVPAGQVVAEATVAVVPWPAAEVAEKTRANIKRRKNTQPTGVRSCGSTFKNPPGYSAWKLIDMAGLRERRIGDAMISPKHTNFLINTGHATAKDYVALMDLVVSTVQERLNITLEPEVKVVGEAGARD